MYVSLLVVNHKPARLRFIALFHEPKRAGHPAQDNGVRREHLPF